MRASFPLVQLGVRALMCNCTSVKKCDVDDDDDDDKIKFVGGKVHLINTMDNWNQKFSEAKKDGKIVVANFSAAWCGPCRQIASLYNELSEKFPSFMFLMVDVDELTEFSSSWDINATPTFFFLRDGQQIDKLVGANKPELEKKIEMLANSVRGATTDRSV